MSTPTKIYYIANARMPTERAHGVQLAKMCEAFIEAGADIELIVPERKNAITEDIQTFYGLRTPVPVKKIPTIDWYLRGKIGFWIGSISFMIRSFFYLRAKEKRGERFVVYTIDMDQFSFALLPFLESPLAVEIHDAKESGLLFGGLFKKAIAITVINDLIRKALMERFHIPTEKILVFPNGIDLSFFDVPKSRVDIEGASGKKKVMYVGKFYGWKGMDILLETAKRLQDDTVFVIVGGGRKELEQTLGREVPGNIICVGSKPYHEIPSYLASADLLLVLGTRHNDYSYYYTSPMKLFEYMAARRPIIASDTPAIREIVTPREVFLYTPDDSVSLANVIAEALKAPEEGMKRSSASHDRVKEYSWEKRAELILGHIHKHYAHRNRTASV